MALTIVFLGAAPMLTVQTAPPYPGLSVNADGRLGSVVVNGTVEANPGYGYVPIGTVVAWYAVSEGAQPPVGWVRCDGQTITLESGSAGDRLDGTADGSFLVPDLNAYNAEADRGIFLRGGATAGTYQGDAVKKHTHGTGSPAYKVYMIEESRLKYSGTPATYEIYRRHYYFEYGTNTRHYIDDWKWYQTYQPSYTYCGSVIARKVIDQDDNYHFPNESEQYSVVTTPIEKSVYAQSDSNISTTTRGTFDNDETKPWESKTTSLDSSVDETRPANMSVVWIIRVF